MLLRKTTAKRKYSAIVILPWVPSQEGFKSLPDSLRKSVGAKADKIRKTLSDVWSIFPLDDTDAKPFFNVKGFEKFFVKNFSLLLSLSLPYDDDVDLVNLVQDSVKMVDFYPNNYGMRIEYHFDARIDLGRKDLLGLLGTDISFDTENIFVRQAIPRNKADIATELLRLAKTSNPNWSPRKKVYSNEDLQWASDLVDLINPLDEDGLEHLGLSEQTKAFLFHVYGKNFYVDSLFNAAMTTILDSDDGTSLNVDHMIEIADQESESLQEGNVGPLSGQIEDFFRVEPIAEDEVGERMTEDEAYSELNRTKTAKRNYLKYLITNDEG